MGGAARKQEMVVWLIEADDITAYADALRFIIAAKAGEMAAIGIARAHDADLLAEAGADIVTTLDKVDRPALADGRLATRIA